ncbi:MAPEG family protein [Colwellia sp. RSH04]|uniref:MAPEG family protein n=1 Tax=Colwellia sp. RSH04 TaxID=2305464 RepID=UPI000E57AB51|nr:MAPEG family protein [Colwellia sp. RSH04]RHW77437.1 MAPEG family protein [Colwellia sp. RSH04]
MTILYYSLFVALLLPYVAKVPVAWAMNKKGGYDNKHPRAQQSTLTGIGARALAAHQNAFESLIIFVPAVLLAITTNNDSTSMITLAVVHVIARVLYNILYLINLSTLRSLSWAVATVASFTMLFLQIP